MNELEQKLSKRRTVVEESGLKFESQPSAHESVMATPASPYRTCAAPPKHNGGVDFQSAITRRRATVDGDGETFESTPSQKTADAIASPQNVMRPAGYVPKNGSADFKQVIDQQRATVDGGAKTFESLPAERTADCVNSLRSETMQLPMSARLPNLAARKTVPKFGWGLAFSSRGPASVFSAVVLFLQYQNVASRITSWLDMPTSRWATAVHMVESDDFCVEVLKCRQRDGLLPACGISRDVVTYQPSGDALAAELVVGGFPCQGVSKAGLQAGTKEARKRDLDVTWTSLSLNQVGLSVGRKRDFLLLSRAGFKLPDGCLMEEIDLTAAWNKDGEVPLCNWLQDTETVEDASRLRTMGNIVVPLQAKKALSSLSEMQTLLRSC